MAAGVGFLPKFVTYLVHPVDAAALGEVVADLAAGGVGEVRVVELGLQGRDLRVGRHQLREAVGRHQVVDVLGRGLEDLLGADGREGERGSQSLSDSERRELERDEDSA